MRILTKNLFMISLLSFFTVTAANAQDPKLVFADDFNGQTLDLSKWQVTLGDGCPDLCGFGNREKQTYTDAEANLRVENGVLKISAFPPKKGQKKYTSAKITTEGLDGWTGGVFSIRAKLPAGKGTWPAFWLLPKENTYGSWPDSGEIDIMEHVGYNEGYVHGTIHTKMNNHKKGTQLGDRKKLTSATEEFHTYSLIWRKDTLIWMIDNEVYYWLKKDEKATTSEWPFDHPYYLILNLAVGGDWGGAKGIKKKDFPTTMEIDWVKVWQETD